MDSTVPDPDGPELSGEQHTIASIDVLSKIHFPNTKKKKTKKKKKKKNKKKKKR
jgi:hypothetical protein